MIECIITNIGKDEVCFDWATLIVLLYSLVLLIYSAVIAFQESPLIESLNLEDHRSSQTNRTLEIIQDMKSLCHYFQTISNHKHFVPSSVSSNTSSSGTSNGIITGTTNGGSLTVVNNAKGSGNSSYHPESDGDDDEIIQAKYQQDRQDHLQLQIYAQILREKLVLLQAESNQNRVLLDNNR